MYYPNGTFSGYNDPSMYSGNFMAYNYPPNIQQPLNQNALTAEEIQKLKSQRPSGTLNLQISEDDVLRATCTHCENGHSVVQEINDGSGDVFCPICNARWNSSVDFTKEEVKELCDRIIAIMQSSKWMGEIPANIVREYFPMIPLLAEFPNVFEYAAKNMTRLYNQRSIYNGGDASLYANYNSLFGAGYGPTNYGMTNYGYQPQPPMGYYNQPPVQPAAPTVNPMAINQQYPYQQPQQGNSIYTPGYNPQFTQQANMMMPQNNPYAAPLQQPVYGQPQVQGQQQAQQPQQPSQQQQVVTSNNKIDL